MAEESGESDKTEEPTQKRLDEALKRGDVVKSQEVNTWFVIAGATLVLMAFSGTMSKDLTTTMRGLIANSHDISVDGPALAAAVSENRQRDARGCGDSVSGADSGGARRQHHSASAGVVAIEALAPKLSKISPLPAQADVLQAGAGQSGQGPRQDCGWSARVLTALMWPERGRLEALTRSDPSAIMPLSLSLALKLLGAVVAMLAVVAAADYLFQYRQWYERQKMSLRELKEEFKQTEGDPAIKGKMKQVRQIRMRRRMIAAVPKATVVITNPTHYAVALEYERGMDAPVCVAKGVDALGPENQGGRRRAFGSDRRKSAACARPACHCGDRSANSARALQGGRRSHRLCHAAAPDGVDQTLTGQYPKAGLAEAGTCADRAP